MKNFKIKNNNQSTPISHKQLNEYAKLVETQKFDLRREEEDKIGRLGTLLLGMPDQKMKMALNQVIKYKANKNSRQSQKGRTSGANDVDDLGEGDNSGSAMVIDDDDLTKTENSKISKNSRNETVLPGYETMMMNESSILVGYETMMIDESSSKEAVGSATFQTKKKDTDKEKDKQKDLTEVISIATANNRNTWNDPKTKSDKMSSNANTEERLNPGENSKQTSKISQIHSNLQATSNLSNENQLATKSGIKIPNHVSNPVEFNSISSKATSLSCKSTENKNDDIIFMTDNKTNNELNDDSDTAIKAFPAQKDQNLNSNLRYIIIDGSNVARE